MMWQCDGTFCEDSYFTDVRQPLKNVSDFQEEPSAEIAYIWDIWDPVIYVLYGVIHTGGCLYRGEGC